jgi:hypothetical protein
LDAPRVGTMTKGSSVERGKQLLRRGQRRERGTRKAKIEGHRPKTAQNRVLKLDSWLAFTRLGLI